MKRNLILLAVAIGAFSILTINVNAQIKTPAPSPTATVTQDFGLGKITITYSRPSVKDRTIFGALVPYDQMWRTGANKATSIQFSDDVQLNGNAVKAGTYSLFTIPGTEKWSIILNSDTELWGTDEHDATKDVAKFDVVPVKTDFTVETFTININDIRNNEATLNLVWENTMVSIDLTTEIDEKIMDQIKSQTAGVNPNTYYAAARYYYETDRDIDQALKWIDMAQEKEQKFWMMRWKAQMLAKKGKYKEAIAAAEQSTKLAVEAKNEDYPRMNAESIAEWKKK